MTFISGGGRSGGVATAAPTLGRDSLTYAPGMTIVSPDGLSGPTHLIVEAPPAPLVTGLIDLSITTAQVVEVLHAGGRYIIDSFVFERPDGAVGDATITIRTHLASRGGGRLLVDAQPLAALAANPKAIIQLPIALGQWVRAPLLYVTIASPGAGTMRLAMFGRLLEMDDPESRTYGRRRLDRVG